MMMKFNASIFINDFFRSQAEQGRIEWGKNDSGFEWKKILNQPKIQVISEMWQGNELHKFQTKEAYSLSHDISTFRV